MEDTLRAHEYAEQHDLSIVLILVLMEDTLRASQKQQPVFQLWS